MRQKVLVIISRNMEFTTNQRKNAKRTLLLFTLVVIITSLLTLGLYKLPFDKNPTSLVIDGSVGSQDEESRSGSENSNSLKSTESLSNKNFKNIGLNGDVKMESYVIPIVNSDVEITAEQLIITSPQMDVSINLEEPMRLKGFTGYIIWKDARLLLKGSLSEYMTKYIKINPKSSDDLILRIENGSITIDALSISKLEGVSSGSISISSKITIDVEKDYISIVDYRGILKMSVMENVNTISLDGKISELNIKTENFDAGIH